MAIESWGFGVEDNTQEVTSPDATNLQAITLSGNFAEHFNGNVGLVAAEIVFSSTSKTLCVKNTHGTNDLYVSLDGGSNYATLKTYDYLSADIELDSIFVKGSGVGTTYEIIAAEISST